ncbi:hypothetical protein ES703_119321 [subsurface metagenome]
MSGKQVKIALIWLVLALALPLIIVLFMAKPAEAG